MRITEQQRQQTEDRIRAAADRLLNGQLPSGGKCDVKTLASEAGVTRAALYTTYLHLKEDFERRRDRLRDAGTIPDPREAQIGRLKKRSPTTDAAGRTRPGDHRVEGLPGPGRVAAGRPT